MYARQVTEPEEALGLVEGHPPADPVGQRADDGPRVFDEPADDRFRSPAAQFVHPEGHVPVVQRDHRFDPRGQQGVDKIGIKREPLGVDASVGGHDAAPADGEAVGVQAQLLHQRDVLAVPVIMIAGNAAVVAVPDVPFGQVPYASAPAAFVPRAFDLRGRARRAPEKSFRICHTASSRYGCIVRPEPAFRPVRTLFPPVPASARRSCPHPAEGPGSRNTGTARTVPAS